MAIQSHHSSKVALTLIIDDRELALSHVDPAEVTVRDTCPPIGPCEAQLIITVDDEQESTQVFLPHGISCAGQSTPYL